MATWTTATILATDTMDRCRRAVRSSSTISKPMRRGMGMEMSARPVTLRGMNMRSLGITAVAGMQGAGDITRAGFRGLADYPRERSANCSPGMQALGRPIFELSFLVACHFGIVGKLE
jgi:hypothetical protein